MKFLVFSDSHSRSSLIDEAIEMHNGICDGVIFLGDGISDFEYIKMKYPSIPFFAVKGNCDMFTSQYEEEMLLNFDGIKIFVTHGHKYGVKYSYDLIENKAFELGADAVFFGHTHVCYDGVATRNDKTIRVFNPGSISHSHTYGVINTSGKVIITSIAPIY